MKRVGNLIGQVCAFPTLLAAAAKARAGCGWTPEARSYVFRLEPELLQLQEALVQEQYLPGAYRFFRITDPKPRTIAVAPFRDRVVHQAVVSVLTPVYEPCFIYDSYATRPGKGTHAAVERAQAFLRRWPWYLKLDVKHYFETVDHDILLDQVQRKIKDRPFLRLLERIIRNPSLPGRGLPIGNLTSQFLANVYLDPLDHYLKEELRLAGVIRYMDDIVVYHDETAALRDVLGLVERFVGDRLRLCLKPEAIWLNRSHHGLSFLGMRIHRGSIRVRGANRRRSLQRLRTRWRAWEQGLADEDAVVASAASVTGHLRHFCPRAPLSPWPVDGAPW